MTASSPAPARLARRGFTLTELMVGLLLTTIVVAALYNMFVTASYIFNVQSQASATQLRLRSAMEQVKDDVRRAGLMSTPNSDRDTTGVCPPPVPRVHAVVHGQGAGSDQADLFQSYGNDLSPDTLILSGNFTSSAAYPGVLLDASRIVVQLAPWTGPEAWEPSIYTQDGFELAFRPDQYVRVSNAYGSAQFAPLASVDGGQRSLELAAPLKFSSDGTCGLTGTGDYLEVNPVQHVLYRIEPRRRGEADMVETDLVRSFWDPAGQVPVDGTDVVVGQNVVDFQVWFTVQDPATPAAALPDDPDLSDEEGPEVAGVTLDGTAGARPDLVRVAAVRLCARGDREDARWMFRPRAEGGPLLSVNLDGDQTMSARVTCLTSEVEVVNLSLRNLQG